MLPTVLLTLAASFSWNADASPVYNMQPAYITANIGTTGRNIRNLPCISRKTNQNGVCMFAIDCLKANGTHLGTCIDRFYFGSCCHIEPTHDIIDNSIETSIFPGREPPNRLNATEKPTTQKPTTTTRPPIILTKEPGIPDTTTEVSYKLTTFQNVDGSANEVQTTTFKPPINISHKPKPPVLEKKPLTTKPPSLTRPITLKTTPASPSKPFPRPTQARPKPPPTAKPIKITKPPYKPLVTTKQPSKPLKQTAKPTKTTTRRPTTKFTPKVTQKPVNRTTTTTPQPSSVTTQKIEDISLMETISRLPSPETTTQITKPFNETTPKTPEIITKRPDTRPSTLETKPSTISSKQPEATTSKIPEVTSTTPKPLVMTSKIPEVVTLDVTTKSTTAKVDQTTSTPGELNFTISSILTTMVTTESSSVAALNAKPSEASANDSLASNDVFLSNLNISAVLGAVNGNVATNEIESVKPIVVETTTEKTTTGKPPMASTTTTTTTMRTTTTTTLATTTTTPMTRPTTTTPTTRPTTTSTTTITPKTTTTTTEKPGLITWTLPEENQHTSVANTTNEDWVPITTPDGWVLLPSVTTSTESSPTILTTLPSLVNSTQESSQVTTDKIAENATVSLVLETSTQAANVSLNATESVEATSSTSESTGPTTELSQETALNMSDFTNVCGRRMYPEGRIVGGEKSNYGKWPWQISLRQWRTSTYLHKCGAALLNENWAITAAHCVDNVPPSDLLLRLGEHDLSTDLEPYLHQERRVQIVASHPQFDPRTFEYDLALLRFYEPVKFQPNIIPVCVPQSEENFVGRTAYVTGWGRLYEDGPLPSVLQEVSVPVINNTLCESMYRMAGYIEHIPHIFICAGWRRGGFDSCEGDSGGPMVIQREDKRFLLAGVISWGIGCAEPNQPGVYTRISEFRDWINQILQF